MKLIVESGATKTSWRAISVDGTVCSSETAGLSPTCLDAEEINDIVRLAVPELNPEGRAIEEIHFYGAGLVSESSVYPVRSALETWCPFAEIYFHSDLMAAARALFGNSSGIVAIMGTGSNSCLYENSEIVRNIRPGGFILGDEGSGACLGKMFISDFIKGLLPAYIEKAFIERFGLDYADIVRKVYKEATASAFLASFAPFILENLSDGYVNRLVHDCLESFVSRTLSRYSEQEGPHTSAVGVVGSFGFACRDIMTEIGSRYDLQFIKFIKSPIDELVKYHLHESNY